MLSRSPFAAAARAARAVNAAKSASPRAMATMRPVTAGDRRDGEEFFAKNERLSRPVSPHLTIYRPQMTSMLSITHRGTGVAQSGMLSGFAIGAMLLPTTFPQFLLYLQSLHLGPAVIFGAKLVIAWPFAYHLLNGIRHLAWDMGWGFKMPDLYKTGYTVMALSVVLAAALAAI